MTFGWPIQAVHFGTSPVQFANLAAETSFVAPTGAAHGRKLRHEILTLDGALQSMVTMKVREVIRLLKKRGWVEMRSRGSHRHFKHPNEPSVVTVPGQDGKELAPGTLNAILRKAGLK